MSEPLTSLPNLAWHGLMGAGKSTMADLCVEHFGYQRVSFAGLHPGGLRDLATRLWGEEARNDRDKLQKMGMACRLIDEDCFVNALLRELNDPDGLVDRLGGPFVLDDLRFPNEAWALKGEGFTITRVAAGYGTRLNRLRENGKLQDESQMNHPSEGALKTWPDDWKIINERKSHKELLAELTRVIEHGTR